ncbi:hypothetical protein CK203_115956 [Vitis vinifera]|uniref:Retrotransposon gag domain-containing protein n=1 Tax=Vitis vinifera TaxID=29760 RepID=A0A438EIU7_VITVI|nr:hypothetical protein CK203_115956 [Vitis vinifera]
MNEEEEKSFSDFYVGFLELPTLGKLLDSKETSISYLLRAFEGKSKVKDHLNGAPVGHESAGTPIGHESNGAAAGEGVKFIVIPFQSTCDFHHKFDSGGRLVKCDTPHNKEFELSLNIMEATPEDQHSHQGRQDNLNEFRSMRDRMHPPRMSAPSSKENEKFYECWERYMEAINACPHHGFDTWLLVSHFYDGMSSSMKQLLKTMCGGDFMSKNPEEAMDFLNYVAEVSRGWDEPTKGEVGKMKSQLSAFNAKAGMYTLKEDDDMKAKLAAVTRRLEELELKKVHEVQAIAEAPVQVKLCPNCQSYEHLVEECPAISAEREMFRDQANVVGQFKPNNNAPYGNTYNSSWRNHPNFSWKARATQYHQPDQPSQQSSSLEQAIANLSKVVGDFVGNQEATNAQSIKELTEWRVL